MVFKKFIIGEIDGKVDNFGQDEDGSWWKLVTDEIFNSAWFRSLTVPLEKSDLDTTLTPDEKNTYQGYPRDSFSASLPTSGTTSPASPIIVHAPFEEDEYSITEDFKIVEFDKWKKTDYYGHYVLLMNHDMILSQDDGTTVSVWDEKLKLPATDKHGKSAVAEFPFGSDAFNLYIQQLKDDAKRLSKEFTNGEDISDTIYLVPEFTKNTAIVTMTDGHTYHGRKLNADGDPIRFINTMEVDGKKMNFLNFFVEDISYADEDITTHTHTPTHTPTSSPVVKFVPPEQKGYPYKSYLQPIKDDIVTSVTTPVVLVKTAEQSIQVLLNKKQDDLLPYYPGNSHYVFHYYTDEAGDDKVNIFLNGTLVKHAQEAHQMTIAPISGEIRTSDRQNRVSVIHA